LTNKLIGKSKNDKLDLTKFFVLSLIIFFFLDVIFTKISEQSLYQYFVNYIPGLQETLNMISISTEDLNLTSQNITPSLDPKFRNIQQALTIFIGPTLGSLILFSLRQLSYRSRSNDEHKHPGVRILLIFLIITTIILIFDLYRDLSDGFSFDTEKINFKELIPAGNLLYPEIQINSNQSKTPSTLNNTKLINENIINYEINNLLMFLIKLSLTPYFIISIISIWFFDRYLFSRLWNSKETNTNQDN
jgi:hypothetical protein